MTVSPAKYQEVYDSFTLSRGLDPEDDTTWPREARDAWAAIYANL